MNAWRTSRRRGSAAEGQCKAATAYSRSEVETQSLPGYLTRRSVKPMLPETRDSPPGGKDMAKARRSALIKALVIMAIVAALVPQAASADPGLPLPRLPICGDQDGSETPVRFRCPNFIPSTAVQTYRVQGEGDIDLRFDFVFREAAFNNELVVFVADDPSWRYPGFLHHSKQHLRQSSSAES